MDEKLKFIARYLEGEKKTSLFAENSESQDPLAIGYKLIKRYKV